MSLPLQFKITTPERTLLEENISQVTVPTELGQITILPHHIPLVSNLVPGEIIVKKGTEEISMVISGGFIEVTPNNVIILADTAERLEEIDEQRAEEGRKRAEQLLKEKHIDSVEYAMLASKIEKELARLRVVRKRRPRSM